MPYDFFLRNVITGLVTALLTVSVLFFPFAMIPSMLVGLAWGLYSTITSIIISFVLLGLWLNIGIAIGMAITIGLPTIFFVRQALLSRPTQADNENTASPNVDTYDNERVYYPPERLIIGAIVFCTSFSFLAFGLSANNTGGLPGLLQTMILSNENFIRENDLSTFREQLSFHKSYEKKTSQKIYGPPGTGKTKTLIDKIEYHIEQGIKPNEIAFLTYSNQAAEIAKERIIQKFPNLTLNDFPYFSTIHSFATKLGGLSGKSLFTEEFYKRFDTDIIVNKQMTALADIESLKDRVTHPILDQLTSSIQSHEELDDEKFFKISKFFRNF